MFDPPPHTHTQLDKLVEKQRETHRRMLEQLLLAEQAHKQALFKLEDEKKNHGEFMKKSDEFTNLLEQERERSEPPPASVLLKSANFSLNHLDDFTISQLQYCKWPLGGKEN